MASRHSIAAALAGAVLVTALAGCVPSTPTPVPTQTAAEPSAAPSATAPAEPVLVEGGTAEENKAYFDKVNGLYFERNGIAASQSLFDNLVASGFRAQDIEVTEDRTSLDLQADSVVISVRIKGECLVGGFAQAGYKGIIAPLLGTGSCLIGTTLPIN
jgi:hypothetical protein